jgi:glycosyltransferase involved in cell wall biosynthesis
MATLSLGMIVKNEEDTMERVLSCVKSFADEIVIADTGSTDKTVEIAEKMGARVVHFKWIDHFAAARNFAFENCTSDWLMWLDADDIITEENQARILQVKENDLSDEIDGVFMTYRLFATQTSTNVLTSFHRERLIRRGANLKWEYPVHECIALPYGRQLYRADVCIDHRPLPHKLHGKSDRNLKILEKALERKDHSPRNLFYYANELRDHANHEKALTWYKKYIMISNVEWEKYAAYMSMCGCCEALGKPEEGMEWAMKAMFLDSERAEAFNKIGIYFYKRELWAKAIPFFQAASVLPKPSHGFVSDADYGWVPWDYLSICYDRVGDYHKAIESTLKAVPNNPDKARLIKNMHWFADNL